MQYKNSGGFRELRSSDDGKILWTLLRLVHNTTLNNALHSVVFMSTLVETQHDARIDLDPILAFPCVAFLHLSCCKCQW